MSKKKIEFAVVEAVVTRNEQDPRKVAKILNDLREVIAEIEATGESDPPVKKKYVPIICDVQKNFATGWVVQIPEDASPSAVLGVIKQAIDSYNTTRKGRKNPIHSLTEAFEFLPKNITSELGLWIKTKEVIEFVSTEEGGAL